MTGLLHRRRLTAVLTALGAAAALVACTLTQSLDYLQKGDGPVADAGSEQPIVAEGGSPPKVLVPNQTKPGLLAQDDGSLYWVAAGTVMSVPKSGGAPKMLGMAPAARWLAADPDPSGAVFLAVGRDIVRLPKDGSGGGAIFKAAADAPEAASVAADQNALFLLQYDDNVAESYVLRMAKDGGGAVNIAGDASTPSTMTVDTNTVFWLDLGVGDGVLYELPKAAAAGTAAKALPLAMSDDSPAASENLAADESAVYWATDGALGGMPAIVTRKRDPAASVIALYRGKAEDVFGTVALDATNIYVIETVTNAIVRVPKAGGSAVTLVTGLPVAKGLVVGATSVYVTVEATGNTGAVLEIAK